MNTFNTIIAIIATISLFIFSLNGFSKELQLLGSEKLKSWIEKVTANRIKGFILGAGLTAFIQSSSVVTSITVAMVDAEIIAFNNSLPVLIGANIGTTFTAWLVAFKISNLGSWLLVIGSLISIIPYKIKLAGKSIFYLGLILFSLQQINLALAPIGNNTLIAEWLAKADNMFLGILAGMIATAVVQSSSVITGLIIILAGQNLLSLDSAIAIVIGSNLGTTSTALLASATLSKNAKRSALANLMFNLIGLIIFLPFISIFTKIIYSIQTDITYQIAFAHLIFNFTTAIIILPMVPFLSKTIVSISDRLRI